MDLHFWGMIDLTLVVFVLRKSHRHMLSDLSRLSRTWLHQVIPMIAGSP